MDIAPGFGCAFPEAPSTYWTGLDNPEQGRCRYQANRL